MGNLLADASSPIGQNIGIVFCKTSRQYYPPFVSKDIIASNLVLIIPNAEIYHFGILTSSIHMAFMKVVCGRMKSDYRYSNTIVYNNFPWCTPTDEQKAKIEQTAQAILDARAKYRSEEHTSELQSR